ncbi:hypothetical protein LOK49_LG10G00903 [Camellia lanceoleosa]|uniref:Uncharacterized protein n=1 Tax=Camellia lanceoleosa TaxID=1840588 RepID=A0ACC0G996_9ERIC|nr:hypothetical protein LOK49_LG10G00903 [Camellia lanceoleosa]
MVKKNKACAVITCCFLLIWFLFFISGGSAASRKLAPPVAGRLAKSLIAVDPSVSPRAPGHNL